MMKPSLPHEAAASLGFPTLVSVSSLISIAHLFGSTKKRCGIYLLVFREGFFYVGQAVDVVRRFSQHRRVHNDIIGFSFLPITKSELDTTERTLIFRAEKNGIKLTNAIHVTNIVGDTDLDLVIPPSKQQEWLCSIPDTNYAASELPKISLPEVQQLRFLKNFSRFQRHPCSQRALALFRQYVLSCLPFPRDTEYSFWSVSCMPSTNNNTWPRLFCVNAGVMELFVAGWEKDNPQALWSFVNVAEDVLIERWPSLEALASTFPFADVMRSGYRDAGQHQVSLQTHDAETMMQLLEDSCITKAAATLALRVMRKRATIYGKFHCPQFVNQALFPQSTLATNSAEIASPSQP